MSKKVSTVLKDKALQIQNGAELIAQMTQDWQQIKRYMTARIVDFTLTEQQQKKLDRYQFIYNQSISGKYSESELISCVTKLYKIEERQAYRDLADTKELFATILNINKVFELKVELESARVMKKKAADMGNLDAYASIQRNIVRLLAQIQQEETLPDGAFEGHVIEAVFDPTLLGAPAISIEERKALLEKINAKRNKKINIEDIGFEMV